MRGGARLGWRLAVPLAFGATAALAVIVGRAPAPSALTLQSGPGSQHAVVTASCGVSELRISMGTGTRVAALVTRYALDFTNVSDAPCTLAGYPEVAAYRGDGVQVGGLAVHDTSVAASRVLLAPGETAHATLDTSLSAKTKCHPVRAAAGQLRQAPHPGLHQPGRGGPGLPARPRDPARPRHPVRVTCPPPG